MLVLTRLVDQKVILTVGDEQVEVIVMRIRGKQVRLGFKASHSVIVNRSENEAVEREPSEEKVEWTED